ncbi:hypothetical protein [Lysobacter capsici]|uniref:hypothetical protein n=1 Tax=Lysobacter capsici TaxID=435897 RepID=UPI00398C83BB
MDYLNRAIGAKLLLTAAMLAASVFAAPQARAEASCNTVSFFPGVVQVYASVNANAGASESKFCTTSFACPKSSRKVEVFGAGLASSPESVVAVDNSALLSTGDEISANCQTATVSSGRKGTVSTCNASAQSTPTQAAAIPRSARCSSTPRPHPRGASATCFCGT